MLHLMHPAQDKVHPERLGRRATFAGVYLLHTTSEAYTNSCWLPSSEMIPQKPCYDSQSLSVKAYCIVPEHDQIKRMGHKEFL